MATRTQIETALDQLHLAATVAFSNKDAAGYQSLFGSDLEYVQANGETIGKTRLMKDVQAQFKTLDRADSQFTREKLEVDGHEVKETLLQIATFETSAFGFIRRIFRVERTGIYTWVVEDGLWKIVRVQVLDETVASRWKLGR